MCRKVKTVSFILAIILTLNALFSNTVIVFAESASETQKSFLNFSASSDAYDLNMSNLTTGDYYTLAVFMSNFYEPGVTTLKDITNPTSSDFYSKLETFLGKSGDANLSAIVKAIGTDTQNALGNGSCTLVDSSNNFLNGLTFLKTMRNSVSLDLTYYDMKLKSEKIYYETKDNLAFDFSSPAVKAAFQTLASYNSNLFLSADGIESLELMFIDAVGNVWGVDVPSGAEIPTKKADLRGFFSANGIGIDSCYLILPACLNPSTFTNNIKSSDGQQNLKMPLLNSFVLGALLDKEDLDYKFIEEYIPLYNLFADTGVYSDASNTLSVFGLNSLTPYALNTNNIENEWINKNLNLIESIYKSEGMLTSLDNNSNLNGSALFNTNSYIVFSTNLYKIVGKPTSGNTNLVQDLSGASLIPFYRDYAFSVFSGEDGTVKHQIALMSYLFTPTLLNINQVSMNFFLNNGSDTSTPMQNLSGELNSNGSATVEDLLESKVGLKGLGLFLRSDEEVEIEGEKYRRFVADRNIYSKFMNELKQENQNISWSDLIKVMDGDISSLGGFGKDIYNLQINDNKWTEMDFNSGLMRIKIKPKRWVAFNNWSWSGNDTASYAFSNTFGLGDSKLLSIFDMGDGFATNTEGFDLIKNAKKSVKYLSAFYGYTLFFPSETVMLACKGSSNVYSVEGAIFNNVQYKSGFNRSDLGGNGQFWMGIYFGYLVDMLGLTTVDGEGISFGTFGSPFLPNYNISANGGSLSVNTSNGSSGVINTEDTSFEEMQKDLIKRIYGITNDSNNDYRNNLIKNILEGFILTVHRTITGTWGSNISSVSTGDSSTYQSVTGYIYTPTLEELSFTAGLMNNYIQVYVLCMLIVLFLMVLLVILHMRSWRQGIIICLVMSIALLFPYLLISNSVSVSNKISNGIYSDRFDFWAMSQYQSSLAALNDTTMEDEKNQLLAQTIVASDSTRVGSTGVKVKWMSPKKVDMFQNLYSDTSLSQSFVTNMTIFKWLFSSFVYDSEFVDVDTYGSYVYRPYNSVAIEAKHYYSWGEQLFEDSTAFQNSVLQENGINYSVPIAFKNSLNKLTINGKVDSKNFLSIYARLDPYGFYSGNSSLIYSNEKIMDMINVSQLDIIGNMEKANKIGLWGILDVEIADVVGNDLGANGYGIVSNLPTISKENSYENSDYNKISRAMFLKNTESPYYYFYSVLKYRYSNNNNNTQFKDSLLKNEVFRYKNSGGIVLNTDKNLNNKYRDFLDLEGLFSYIIPYMTETNKYVEEYRKVYGDYVPQYNFDYKSVVDEVTGEETIVYGENADKQGLNQGTFKDDAIKKNNMNRVWNLYSPWVDSLNDLSVYNKKTTVGGKSITISNTLNPSSYLSKGRPMIFSEADMVIKGYTYKDLTDVERRIQAVTEKTYKDLMYLVNYYDMQDEVLLSAAAMYATFNFNQEFSQTKFLGESVMLYPQGLELKNFNYDAFMRLALLNSTGESVFATEDLYERVLAKTSVFTGLLLLVCDLIACILIPLFKFIILVGLLFLGVLVCIACVVNPPEKVFEAVLKSILQPTVLFMVLNIGFSWVMSFIIGEGLTSYVGSKGVNFVTNDPTITMLIMAFLGIAYLFFAWKILKYLIQAYKNFGMGTALAAVGIVGAAIAAGTAGVAKRAQKVGAFGLGAGVGAVVAGKGNRLGGAVDGAQKGAGAMINSRIREKRAAKDFASATGGKPGLTDKLNGLSNEMGSGNGLNGKDPVKDEGTTKIPKQGTKIDKSKTPEPPSELGKPFEKATNKNATGLGKVISGGYYLKEKAKDTLDSVKHKTIKTGMALKNVGQGIKEAPRKTANAIKDMPNKATNYWNKSLKQAKEDGEFYELLGDTRKGERVADEMGTGRELATRQRKFDEESKAIKEAKSAKKEAKKRRVDGDYSLQEA